MSVKKVLFFGILIVLLSSAMAACAKQASIPTAVQNTPEAQSQATVAQPSVASVVSTESAASSSDSIQWPSKMPTDVPQFTYGTIIGSSNNVMGNIQATYKNATADAFTKYLADLKAAGWTISVSTQSADGFEIDAAKAPRGVVAMFINTKNNGLKGAVTYNDHSGQ
jgi:hypothetical protein